VKCGDLIQCRETKRLAIIITPPNKKTGWLKVRWVDSGLELMTQNIAWKNITKTDKKCPRQIK
tara:strand:+ start:311 stop:499 length:189 start_codon:yes stop_codon:yes gene_type:complete